MGTDGEPEMIPRRRTPLLGRTRRSALHRQPSNLPDPPNQPHPPYGSAYTITVSVATTATYCLPFDAS